MKRMVLLVLAVVLVLAVASPALAATGANGAGQEFGLHHASHAQDMTGFSGDINPGVMHEGFSGWMDHTMP